MRKFSMRSFWLPVMIAALVAALFGALLARRGRLLERQLLAEQELRQELQGLKQQNAQLRAERDALLSSPEAIERVAREEYGYSSPGESAQPVPAGRSRAEVPASAAQDVRHVAWNIAWRDVPLYLTGAVFIVSAVVFALMNLLSHRQTST